MAPRISMNKPWVLTHLREAVEELSRTIGELEDEPDASEVELEVALTHVYHHLNTAWNSRAATDDETAGATQDEFYRWRAFPTDIPLPS
jgi:hypothetical protein